MQTIEKAISGRLVAVGEDQKVNPAGVRGLPNDLGRAFRCERVGTEMASTVLSQRREKAGEKIVVVGSQASNEEAFATVQGDGAIVLIGIQRSILRSN